MNYLNKEICSTYMCKLSFSFLLFGWLTERQVWCVYSHLYTKQLLLEYLQNYIVLVQNDQGNLTRAFLENDCFIENIGILFFNIFTLWNTEKSNCSYWFLMCDFCSQGKLACVFSASMWKNTQTGHQDS